MAPKPEHPTLSLFGKLGLLPILAAVLGRAVVATSTGFLVSKKDRPPTYFKWVLFNCLRALYGSVNSAQEQWITPTTGAVYKAFCKKEKLPVQTTTLEDGETKIHWLGEQSADYVLIYYHGGGYNLPGDPSHFDLLNGWVKNAKGKGKSLAVAFLEYDLAPYGTYPRQLSQASLVLNTLLKSRSPSSIILSGDSAGGHLTTNVLQHILQRHPDPSVPEVKLPDGKKLNAAVLISPWVEHNTDSKAYKRNAWKDLLSPIAITRWADNFAGSKSRDQFIAPLTAPSQSWKGLSDVVERVYITSGGDEVLVDDITQFADVLKSQWAGPSGNLVYVEFPGEPHDGMLCLRIIGTKEFESDTVVKGWIEEVISV